MLCVRGSFDPPCFDAHGVAGADGGFGELVGVGKAEFWYVPFHDAVHVPCKNTVEDAAKG